MALVSAPAATNPSRSRIIEAAIDLIAARGFVATTMRQLGEAAGLDNSSLYRHFESKAALVNAVIDHVSAQLLAVVDAHGDGEASGGDEFEEEAVAVALYLFDHPSVARIMMHWFMSVSGAEAGPALSIPAADIKRPHGRLLARLMHRMERGSQEAAMRPIATPDSIVVLIGILFLRPATFGHFLHSLESNRSRGSARKRWEREVRSAVRGAFAS